VHGQGAGRPRAICGHVHGPLPTGDIRLPARRPCWLGSGLSRLRTHHIEPDIRRHQRRREGVAIQGQPNPDLAAAHRRQRRPRTCGSPMLTEFSQTMRQSARRGRRRQDRETSKLLLTQLRELRARCPTGREPLRLLPTMHWSSGTIRTLPPSWEPSPSGASIVLLAGRATRVQ
jgi:hypothetical protein